ncbi:D-methionine transport system substrate-binding protein [Kineothrix alysoides]|uniref:D-methionine transport system substrate-binding protein n=1 Tax=Kineothrix alysoides TaxID=1469948 RepID=A0A4R1QT24_9FIRM|nr:MetQ/NlpA family ABC transporter substrate-binding protein [Kineothrix alysoides]TCL56223.1 D-methionine transport system substrate-binding protein [Kineothrix alysoides]
MRRSNLLPLMAAAILSIGVFAGCGAKAGNAAQETKAPVSESTADTTSSKNTDDSESTDGKNNSAEAEQKETVTITGIADLVPHSEIIEYVTPKLAEQGIIIELVATSADATTNEKTAKGEVDFNYFQHYPYLEEWNTTNGFDLINAGDIHVEPITAYSDKYTSTEEIPDNAVVAIPNDGTNEYRALRILEQNGFIKLNEETATTLSASLTDIEEYIRPLEIVELDSAQIIPTKADYDFFITNTNKALEAKITSTKLFSEGSDSPYANIIAVRAEDKDNPAIIALVKELQSEDTRKFIEEKYEGAVIPANLR